MKLLAFAIRDGAIEAFVQPFFMRSTDEAIRALGQSVADPGSGFLKSPDDYTLYRVGAFDDASGLLSGHDPERVVGVRELIALIKTQRESEGGSRPPFLVIVVC